MMETAESEAVRVDVYFNLHRKLWSLRDRDSGLVTQHARVVVFARGAAFVVGPGGRRRVLESGHKNVHAFVRGEFPDIDSDVEDWARFAEGLSGADLVTYNPIHAAHFYRRESGEAIYDASAVIMVAPENAAPRVWAVSM